MGKGKRKKKGCLYVYLSEEKEASIQECPYMTKTSPL